MNLIIKILLSCLLYIVFFIIYYFLIALLLMLPIALIDSWKNPIWILIMIISFVLSFRQAYITVKRIMNF